MRGDVMAGRLQGKVTLVTGAASGIGRASAILFAGEGAPVAVVDREEAGGRETVATVTAAGGRALYARADVTQEADVQAAVAAALQEFGRLDVLVACAGIDGPGGPITAVSAEGWDQVMAVNAKGVFLAAKHCIPPMQRQGGGTIAIIASDSSFVAGPGMAPYCASKGAVLMLTRALAVDHAKDNIRVNCVCPSIVDTPMVRRYLDAGDRDLRDFGLDRVHTAEQIARHLLYLASDDSVNLNGHALVVDFGGMATSTFPF